MHNISILFVIDDAAMDNGWGLTQVKAKCLANPTGLDQVNGLSLKLLSNRAKCLRVLTPRLPVEKNHLLQMGAVNDVIAELVECIIMTLMIAQSFSSIR